MVSAIPDENPSTIQAGWKRNIYMVALENFGGRIMESRRKKKRKSFLYSTSKVSMKLGFGFGTGAFSAVLAL